jgi:hypothetical protein
VTGRESVKFVVFCVLPVCWDDIFCGFGFWLLGLGLGLGLGVGGRFLCVDCGELCSGSGFWCVDEMAR